MTPQEYRKRRDETLEALTRHHTAAAMAGLEVLNVSEAAAAIDALILDLIGEDEDNFSELRPDSLAYNELKRVAEISNHLRAGLRNIVQTEGGL